MKEGEKINLVIVINDFLVGGAQKMIVDQLKYFDKTKFNLYLITLFEFPEKKDFYELVPPHVELIRLNFKIFWDASSWVNLAKSLSKCEAKVVISNLFFSNAATRILGLFMKHKVIIVEHNTYYDRQWHYRFINRLLAPLAYKIVAVSDTVKSFASKFEKIPLNKFKVIYNGINIDEITKYVESHDKSTLRQEMGFGPDEVILVNVARLTDQKNHHLLIEGFARFTQEYKDKKYKLLIVGGGSLFEELKSKIDFMGMKDQIILAGTQMDVSPYYRLSDFYISTSKIEGFGIAHVEAMAFGLPVVSTKTAGPDIYLVDGESGFFINENTVESVVEALIKIMNADYLIMSKNATKVAQKFSIQNAVRQYEELIYNCTT